jgi:3-phosphoshikimate 1-carboxyvinyltransferase
VKTCLLLAALGADGPSSLLEPALSRDHTERMLAAMGVDIETSQEAHGWLVALRPPTGDLRPLQMQIPGDFSAAAFLIVAAAITPGSHITLRNLGLNPTRTGLLATLREMGADIRVSHRAGQSGEPVGDLEVRYAALHGAQVGGERAVAMIDEFPAFAIAAACARGRTEVSQAEELRRKESDRIQAICQELRAQGVQVEEKADGFVIEGNGRLPGGAIASPHGDHRLAMALAVAGLAAQNPIGVENAEITQESFPGFADCLRALGAEIEGLPDG